MRAFKASTYQKALTGVFADPVELKQTLLRDLLNQVRNLRRGRRLSSRSNKLDEAQKLTEVIRLHRLHKITPSQFKKYRELVGLKSKPEKVRRTESNPWVGLFFDYGAVVSVSINKDKPKEGWVCMVEIAGENYETKKFEVVGIAVDVAFETAEAAIAYGKNIVETFGVECLDTRIEKL